MDHCRITFLAVTLAALLAVAAAQVQTWADAEFWRREEGSERSVAELAPFFPGLSPQVQCPVGWWLLLGQCEDVDECRDPNSRPCPGLHTVCRNTPGSYRCQCTSRHTGDPYSFVGCRPDDEICDQFTTTTTVTTTTTTPTTTDTTTTTVTVDTSITTTTPTTTITTTTPVVTTTTPVVTTTTPVVTTTTPVVTTTTPVVTTTTPTVTTTTTATATTTTAGVTTTTTPPVTTTTPAVTTTTTATATTTTAVVTTTTAPVTATTTVVVTTTTPAVTTTTTAAVTTTTAVVTTTTPAVTTTTTAVVTTTTTAAVTTTTTAAVTTTTTAAVTTTTAAVTTTTTAVVTTTTPAVTTTTAVVTTTTAAVTTTTAAPPSTISFAGSSTDDFTFDFNITTATSTAAPVPEIPSGYSRCLLDAESSASFYRLHTESAQTWDDANAICAQDHPNAHLVKITDQSVNDCLKTWFLFHTNVYYSWIGLRRVGGQFRWTDGTLAAGVYENWGTGQPLNPTERPCVRLYSLGGRWETDVCSNLHAFFCQITV